MGMKKLLLALTIMAGTAHAAVFWDGNRLYSKMRGDPMDQMLALGYVMGVSDAADTISACTPSNVTAGQTMDVVKQYLEQYPAVRHLSADIIVARSLERLWPCETKKKGNAL